MHQEEGDGTVSPSPFFLFRVLIPGRSGSFEDRAYAGGGEPVTELADRIEKKLRQELDATHVEVEDESHLHAGHAGAAAGGSHLRAVIVSDRFSGLSRVQAQRLVYSILDQEMGGEIHALSMVTQTIDQD